MRREAGFAGAALAHDQRVEVFAHAIELGRPARREAILTLEAEGEAEIHQLQHGKIGAGRLDQLFQDGVETLAAAHLLVEGGDERAGGPAAFMAPRGCEHHVIQAGTEGVMGRAELFHGYAAIARLLFEMAQFGNRAFAQIAGVGRARGVAQAGEEGEQAGGGGEQRVAAGEDAIGAVGDAGRWG